MYRLVFNGDDFGMNRAVNHGIMDCYREGLLRSATVMANGEGFHHGIGLARANPGLGLGIHLNVTAGVPLTEVPDLVNDEGRFAGQKVLYPRLDGPRRDSVLRQIAGEWQAQVLRFLECGLEPTHLDSHHHSHSHPLLRPLISELAMSLDLPVRMVWWQEQLEPRGLDGDVRLFSDYFYTGFYKENLSQHWWEDLLEACERDDVPRDARVEVMCHPGYLDLDLAECSSYSIHRMVEMRLLLSGDRGWEAHFVLG